MVTGFTWISENEYMTVHPAFYCTLSYCLHLILSNDILLIRKKVRMELLNTPLVCEDEGSSVLIILVYLCFPFLALEAEVLIMYNNCTL